MVPILLTPLPYRTGYSLLLEERPNGVILSVLKGGRAGDIHMMDRKELEANFGWQWPEQLQAYLKSNVQRSNCDVFKDVCWVAVADDFLPRPQPLLIVGNFYEKVAVIARIAGENTLC